MKDEHKRAIALLSLKTRERLTDIVNRLEELAEITPTNEPINFPHVIDFGSDGYDEGVIVRKLEEWDVLSLEPEEYGSGFSIFTTLEKIREVKTILEEKSLLLPDNNLNREREAHEEWPQDFVWINEVTFQAGSFGSISLIKGGNRLKIFKSLTDHRGNWVPVRNLCTEYEIEEKDIRTTMTHLNARLKENGLFKYMEIIPKKEIPGSYRIKIKKLIE